MNKMETELRRLFLESELFYEAMFSGKMMIGKIDQDIRAKIEFFDTGVHKHYDALKVTVLNRTGGTIDLSVFKFCDIIGLKMGMEPYFWDERNCCGWYGFKMMERDYERISDTIHDYMSLFASEDIGYEMRTL